MKTAPNQTLLKTKERVRTSVHIFRIGVGGRLRKRDYFTVRTERRSLVSGIYSWSKEKKTGLQDREECLCEEVDHTHLLCLLWKIQDASKEINSQWGLSVGAQTMRMWPELPDGMSLATLGAWWLEPKEEVCKDKGQTGRNEITICELFISSPFEVNMYLGIWPQQSPRDHRTACHRHLSGTRVLGLHTSALYGLLPPPCLSRWLPPRS